jgi:aspartate racemase
MHIGLIGGIGPAATDYYYRGLIKALAGTGHDLDLTMAHADSPTLIEHLAANDQDTQTKIFLRLIDRLVAAGAECVAVTSIAGHFCIERVIEKSPLPVINLITTVHDEIQKRGLSRVGLLGTKTVMQTGFYGGLPSVEIVVPKGEDLDNVHNDYVEMATQGDATAKHKDTFIRVGAQMCEEQGAEAVLLAGTDLFLAFNGKATNFDVIDCAEIHISVLADQAKA